MKNQLHLLLIVLAAVILSACNPVRQKLKEGIAEECEKCPIDMGMVGEISDISYDEEDNNVVYELTVKKDYPMDLAAMAAHKDIILQSMLAGINSEEGSGFLQIVYKADAGVVFRIIKDSNSLDLTIPKSDIEDIAKGRIVQPTPTERLKLMMEISDMQCPQRIDELTILTSVRVDADYVVYEFKLDENQIDMDEIAANKDSYKQNILQSLDHNDPTIKGLVEACKLANRDICYHYVGNYSGKAVDFIITLDELM